MPNFVTKYVIFCKLWGKISVPDIKIWVYTSCVHYIIFAICLFSANWMWSYQGPKIIDTQNISLQHTTMCINCLLVHNAAPNTKFMHARKSVDHERALGFTMQLYTNCSFTSSNRWRALEHADRIELCIHNYIFMHIWSIMTLVIKDYRFTLYRVPTKVPKPTTCISISKCHGLFGSSDHHY